MFPAAVSRVGRRIPYSLILWCTCLGTSAAASIQVVGAIRGRVGLPPPTASVVCYANGTRATALPESSGLTGTVSFAIQGISATHVSCRFSARGYFPLERTVVIVRDRASFGTIDLVPAPTLALSPIVVVQSLDGKYTYLDTEFNNESSKAIQINALQIRGSAHASTGCFDPRPALVYRLQESLPIQRGSTVLGETPFGVAVEGAESALKDEVQATGSLEKLGCDQARLRLDIPYLIPLAAGERGKVRVAIPQTFHGLAGTDEQRIVFSGWERLSLSFSLGDGSLVEIGLR
jgi:hypothetical protein